jgi:hypothetical protein
MNASKMDLEQWSGCINRCSINVSVRKTWMDKVGKLCNNLEREHARHLPSALASVTFVP